MSNHIAGVILEKFATPPPGAVPEYWTFITLDGDDGSRETFQLKKQDVNKVVIGDYVKIEYKKVGVFRKTLKCNKLELLRRATREDLGIDKEILKNNPNEEVKFCKKCDSENNFHAKYCQECGKKLK